jgi:hypothetical protein
MRCKFDQLAYLFRLAVVPRLSFRSESASDHRKDMETALLPRNNEQPGSVAGVRRSSLEVRGQWRAEIWQLLGHTKFGLRVPAAEDVGTPSL